MIMLCILHGFLYDNLHNGQMLLFLIHKQYKLGEDLCDRTAMKIL